MQDVSSLVASESIHARLPGGSAARIDAVLKGGELRSAFVRAAVLAELERREAALAEKQRRP